MACGGFTCTRTVLAALNVFYIIVAIILISVAAYAKAIAIIATVSVVGGIIACGVFLLLIAIVGLIGAVKHHQVLLFFYMIILFLLFVMQFAIACACLALTDGQQRDLYEAGWNNANDALKMKTQDFFVCCGSFWNTQNETGAGHGHPSCTKIGDCAKDASRNESLPVCCGGGVAPVPVGNGTSTPSPADKCPVKDCWEIIEPKLHDAVKAAGGLGLFFSFTEIIGIWLALRYRNLKDPRANPGAFL